MKFNLHVKKNCALVFYPGKRFARETLGLDMNKFKRLFKSQEDIDSSIKKFK